MPQVGHFPTDRERPLGFQNCAAVLTLRAWQYTSVDHGAGDGPTSSAHAHGIARTRSEAERGDDRCRRRGGGKELRPAHPGHARLIPEPPEQSWRPRPAPSLDQLPASSRCSAPASTPRSSAKRTVRSTTRRSLGVSGPRARSGYRGQIPCLANSGSGPSSDTDVVEGHGPNPGVELNRFRRHRIRSATTQADAQQVLGADLRSSSRAAGLGEGRRVITRLPPIHRVRSNTGLRLRADPGATPSGTTSPSR